MAQDRKGLRRVSSYIHRWDRASISRCAPKSTSGFASIQVDGPSEGGRDWSCMSIEKDRDRHRQMLEDAVAKARRAADFDRQLQDYRSITKRMTTMMSEAEARTTLTAMWVTVQTTRQLQLSLNMKAVEEAAMRRDLDVLQAVVDEAERSQ